MARHLAHDRVPDVPLNPPIKDAEPSPLVGTTVLQGTWVIRLPFTLSAENVKRLYVMLQGVLDRTVDEQLDGRVAFDLGERHEFIDGLTGAEGGSRA